MHLVLVVLARFEYSKGRAVISRTIVSGLRFQDLSNTKLIEICLKRFSI